MPLRVERSAACFAALCGSVAPLWCLQIPNLDEADDERSLCVTRLARWRELVSSGAEFRL